MLDPRFKSLHIVSSFVGWKKNVSLVEEYDKKSLYPMLVKCHEHLHPFIRLNKYYVDQDIFLLRLQFGHFWTNYNSKQISRRACQEGFAKF
jgi:hypothetical protein